jgi:hypothetical protein
MRLQVTGIIENDTKRRDVRPHMDFSASLTNAEKREACDVAIAIIEPGLYAAALTVGEDPTTLGDDYKAPGTEADNPLEHRLEGWVTKLAVVKAHLASLPA